MTDIVEKSTWELLRLLHTKQYFCAFCILLICSIIVPFLKLTAASLLMIHSSLIPRQVTSILASLSSYQLVDLFLGMLFVAFCNSEFFSAHLRIGFVLFAAYCVLSQILMLTLESSVEPVKVHPSGLPTPAGEVVDEDLESCSSPYKRSYPLLADAGGGGSTQSCSQISENKLEADVYTSAANGIALALLAFYGCSEPMLNTAITFNGIALSRTVLGLREVIGIIGQQTNTWVCCVLVFSVVGAPLLVALLAILAVVMRKAGQTGVSEGALICAHGLAPWITADVFSLSMVTFLFAVQGDHLHTTIPDGTFFGISSDWFSGFYVGLGLGAAGFSLKWKAVHRPEDEHESVDYNKTVPMSAAQLAQTQNDEVSNPRHTALASDPLQYDYEPVSGQEGFSFEMSSGAEVASRTASDASMSVNKDSGGTQHSGLGFEEFEEVKSGDAGAGQPRGAQGGDRRRQATAPRQPSSDDFAHASSPVHFDRAAQPHDETYPPADPGTAAASAASSFEPGADGTPGCLGERTIAAQEQATEKHADINPELCATSVHPSGDEATVCSTDVTAQLEQVETAAKQAVVNPGAPGSDGSQKPEVAISTNIGLQADNVSSCSVESFPTPGPGESQEQVEAVCSEGLAVAGSLPVVVAGAPGTGELAASIASQAADEVAGAPGTGELPAGHAATAASEVAVTLASEEPPASNAAVTADEVSVTLETKEVLASSTSVAAQGVETNLGNEDEPESHTSVAADELAATLDPETPTNSTAAGADVPARFPGSEAIPASSSTSMAAPEPTSLEQSDPEQEKEATATVVRKLQEDAVHGTRPASLDSLATSVESASASGTDDVGNKKKKRGFWGKLLRNPIFHVKAAAWTVWGVCFFCVKGPEELTYMKLNHALDGVLPLLNDVINHTLPESLGDCRSNISTLAPAPCIGTGPLYSGTSSGLGVQQVEEQHVLARWVTGLNTINLHSVTASVIRESPKPIVVSIRGTVADMKMSIRIEQCLLGVCRALWDSTDGCCEPNRQFQLVIATDCHDRGGVAEVGDFTLEYFNIDDIVLSENVLGLFKQKLADLTPRVKTSVQELTTKVFQGDTMFLNLTFAQVVSRLWRYNTAGGMTCEDFYAKTR